MSFDVQGDGDFCISPRSLCDVHKVLYRRIKMSNLEQFKKQFVYDASRAFYVGVEREAFIVSQKNKEICPAAPMVLRSIDEKGIAIGVEGNIWSGIPYTIYEPKIVDEFGYELSACQIESRIGPCQLCQIKAALEKNHEKLRSILSDLNLSSLHCEVGPVDMPLDVYPDPSGRYQRITADMPREILLAACRVIGTHVHIGMPDYETALRVYNYVIRHFTELCEIGNGSFGERLAIYRQMAPDYEPKPYASWEEYHLTALKKGFEEDPRKCWTLIRISVHGTIEFRMFGATDSIERICSWAKRCHELCKQAMITA